MSRLQEEFLLRDVCSCISCIYWTGKFPEPAYPYRICEAPEVYGLGEYSFSDEICDLYVRRADY